MKCYLDKYRHLPRIATTSWRLSRKVPFGLVYLACWSADPLCGNCNSLPESIHFVPKMDKWSKLWKGIYVISSLGVIEYIPFTYSYYRNWKQIKSIESDNYVLSSSIKNKNDSTHKPGSATKTLDHFQNFSCFREQIGKVQFHYPRLPDIPVNIINLNNRTVLQILASIKSAFLVMTHLWCFYFIEKSNDYFKPYINIFFLYTF